jgi:hypothetical protein
MQTDRLYTDCSQSYNGEDIDGVTKGGDGIRVPVSYANEKTQKSEESSDFEVLSEDDAASQDGCKIHTKGRLMTKFVWRHGK